MVSAKFCTGCFSDDLQVVNALLKRLATLFYVLLTVQLSIILVINQIDAQNLVL